MFLVKIYGITKYNMNAYTAPRNGGTRMDEDTNPSESQALQPEEGQERKYKEPVDWIEDTIVINGNPMTILFPEDG